VAVAEQEDESTASNPLRAQLRRPLNGIRLGARLKSCKRLIAWSKNVNPAYLVPPIVLLSVSSVTDGSILFK
jgi:hypothetical protein